ncbi:MAG: GGDEF domain-containing protein [Lachnospiraceae bacterium]|nr:GGDEF domain-containing protein [Lachnospiraceae bacterium]
MLYAECTAALLIIVLILNGQSLKKYGLFCKKLEEQKRIPVRYNHFLLATCGYIAVDMTWGLLYEHHEVAALFPAIYSLTVFYFLLMLLTMLAWTRYVVAYLDKRGRRTYAMLHTVWTLVIIGILCLMLNRFYHFMFSYNDAHEYVGEIGRNISFFLQIAFYAVLTLYMHYVSCKISGREKQRYKIVAATSLVLGIALTLQILYAFLPSYAIGLAVGTSLVHSYIEFSEQKEKAIREDIAAAMAADYEAIFYIEIETGEYISFAKSENYLPLGVTESRKDFFREVLDSIEEYVYPEDWEYAKSFYDKEKMLQSLADRHSFSYKYRVMVKGQPRFFLFTFMREKSGQYIILYEKDIQGELDAEKVRQEAQKKTITFSQIAEALATNYDVIYYVDIADFSYVCYETNIIYGQLEMNAQGDDFFEESYQNIPNVVDRRDVEMVEEFLQKDALITKMDSYKVCSLDYRLVAYGKPQYTRMTVRKSSDGTHLIFGVENVNDEVRKEKQHLRELKTEKELARRDELTGVKNKTAYKELEASAQGNIDNGMDYLTFGLVVCDANNLKQINDTLGHAAGDEYIRAAARLLCDIYVHSPVFRIGGDEFVVFLRGNDYTMRHELMDKLRAQVLENKRVGAGVILASGMSEYKPENDSFVSDIFERADRDMYDNKQKLKAQ